MKDDVVWILVDLTICREARETDTSFCEYLMSTAPSVIALTTGEVNDGELYMVLVWVS